MKKVIATVLGLACLLVFSAGSAFAASKLDETVDNLMGISYKWGGTTTKGFDCSGFTMYVFEHFDIALPHTSKGQAQKGTEVAKDNLRAGDLVFFNTDGKGISHVGVYVGDGKFAHASSSNGVTINKLSDSYYAKRYVTARRVLSDSAYEKVAE